MTVQNIVLKKQTTDWLHAKHDGIECTRMNSSPGSRGRFFPAAAAAAAAAFAAERTSTICGG